MCSFNLLSEKANNYFYNLISYDLPKVWPINVLLTSKQIQLKAGSEGGN